MKWFNKWILNRVKAASKAEQMKQVEDSDAKYAISAHPYQNSAAGLIGKNPSRQPDEFESDNAIRFNIYNASGGRVIQTNRYDRQRDRAITGLYVITSDQDFGKEIDKIITMEALK